MPTQIDWFCISLRCFYGRTSSVLFFYWLQFDALKLWKMTKWKKKRFFLLSPCSSSYPLFLMLFHLLRVFFTFTMKFCVQLVVFMPQTFDWNTLTHTHTFHEWNSPFSSHGKYWYAAYKTKTTTCAPHLFSTSHTIQRTETDTKHNSLHSFASYSLFTAMILIQINYPCYR